MGAVWHTRQHDLAGVHGHGVEQRGAAGQAEGILEERDADGEAGRGGGDERAGGVSGERGGGIRDRGEFCR